MKNFSRLILLLMLVLGFLADVPGFGCSVICPNGSCTGTKSCTCVNDDPVCTDVCTPNPNATCPQIFAPVTCSNGMSYPNQCVADAACAKGCVPAG